MSDLPKVTIAVISYNRLRFLRALMTSAKECISYPNIQWIIVDGNSKEPGLREYIQSLDFVQKKVFKDCTHAEAMNTVVAEAEGECLLMLPEDVQFVAKGDWIRDMIEVALENRGIGHIIFNFHRRSTLRWLFGRAHLHIRLGRYRRYIPLPFARKAKTYRSSRGTEFFGLGNMREGICGSGIMSFARTEMWRSLGPWRATSNKISNDSSLGAEEDMVLRYFDSGMSLETVIMRYCVNADIVTDMRGTKARVRGGNKRYGNYMAAKEGDLYYRLFDWSDMPKKYSKIHPLPSVEEVVEPIGFQLPLDNEGNLLKTGTLDVSSEPFEQIF